MPYQHINHYKPSFPIFKNGHIISLWNHFSHGIPKVEYKRKRYTTLDRDFLDIDFVQNGSDQICFVFHGLEGSSHSSYVKIISHHLSERGMDVAAWNFRSCSGFNNLKLQTYHSGATGDLHELIPKIAENYNEIFLVGFSLGGNIVLKYTAEIRNVMKQKLKASCAISVPCHLSKCAHHLCTNKNFIYNFHFLKSLKQKAKTKNAEYPNSFDYRAVLNCNNIVEFDHLFTALIHGFDGAEDYYHRCSSLYILDKIDTRTMILNALDDPFLTMDSFPIELSKGHDYLTLFTTDYGGHVGFSRRNKPPLYVEKALEFFKI